MSHESICDHLLRLGGVFSILTLVELWNSSMLYVIMLCVYSYIELKDILNPTGREYGREWNWYLTSSISPFTFAVTNFVSRNVCYVSGNQLRRHQHNANLANETWARNGDRHLFRHLWIRVCCCKFRCSGTGKRYSILKETSCLPLLNAGFEPKVSDTYSPADWMLADKPTELSRIKLKTWTRQSAPMISKHSAHSTSLPFFRHLWIR